MQISESSMLWIGLGILALLLLVGIAGVRMAFRVDYRLRELLRIATEMEAMVGQIRLHSAPSASTPKPVVQRPKVANVTSKPKPATASCSCQHCGKEFLFYLEGLTEEKSFGRCPACGKLTKLRPPGLRKADSEKPGLVATCGTCSTRIPFNKGEEWTKTNCPVCGSETILQTEESEVRS